MSSGCKIDLKELAAQVEVHFDTGHIFWRQPTEAAFPDKRKWRISSTKRKNLQAFNTLSEQGYLKGVIFRSKTLYAHAIVWAMFSGSWADEVDHIDHDKTNNKISNLRSVSRQENARNTSLRPNNTSGANGVYFNKLAKKWCAYIKANNRTVPLGYFASFEDAVEARREADRLYGYHENHGQPNNADLRDLRLVQY